MTELGFDSKSLFDSASRLRSQPSVADYDPSASRTLLKRIDDLESSLNKKLDSLGPRQKNKFDLESEFLRSRFSSKSKNRGLDQQELLLDSLDRKDVSVSSASKDPDDQEFRMFLRDPSVFEPLFISGIADPSSLDTKSAISDYLAMSKSKESIKIQEPPGKIYNLINFAGGVLFGGGFAAQFLLKGTGSNFSKIPVLFSSNPASVALSLVSVGVSLTDDFQKVIRYGDSVQRIPRNLLANLFQGVVGQQASLFVLAAVLGPLGIQSTLGYMVISATVNIVSQQIVSSIVKRLIFKSQVDLEIKACYDLAEKQEEIDSIFAAYRGQPSPPLRSLRNKKEGIQDEKVISSLSKGFDLLAKPWAWTKQNKTNVLLAGIGYVVYKRSESDLVKNLASSFPNSIINLILVRGFNGIPIRDYAEKMALWIYNKIDVSKFTPGFLKRLEKRIQDRLQTKISSLAIACYFVETVAKTYFNTKVVSLATLQNFDSISFNRNVYGFLSYLENIKQLPSEIGNIFEYLRDFPAVVQGGDQILLETDRGTFEPRYRVTQDSVYISDINTGDLKTFEQFKNENPELLKRLFVSRNGLKNPIFYSLEEWNRIGISDVGSVESALKAGYPRSKIDQFSQLVKQRSESIDKAKTDLTAVFNQAKEKIDRSTERFRFLFSSFEQISNNSLLTLEEAQRKGNILIDAQDPETKGFRDRLLQSKSLKDSLSALEEWNQKYVAKNLQKLSFELEDAFEAFEDGTKSLENREKVLRDSIVSFAETMQNFGRANTVFGSPLPFSQVRIDPLIERIDPKNDVEFQSLSKQASPLPHLSAYDSVESKVAETLSEPVQQREQPSLSSTLKNEKETIQISGFDQKTSISIREIRTNQREIFAALEYEISHARTLDIKTSLENQLSILNKLKELFSKGSSITPQTLDKNAFDSLYQTYESEYKQSLETLKKVNPKIPSNCFFDLTGKWEARRNQDGSGWIVVDSKTGAEIPSACIAKPIFVNLYEGARSLLKKILFLAGNKSGPLIAELIFQSFDSIVLGIAKDCASESGSVHRGACLINSIFLQSVCQNNPSSCPNSTEYAFIDTREFIFGNSKAFANLISFLPQISLETTQTLASTVSSSLETTGKIAETLSERTEALEDLENQRQKELSSSSFGFIVDAKFSVKRQLRNLSDTATSVTNAFVLATTTVTNLSKLIASLSSSLFQVGTEAFKQNPEFISQVVFGSKGLSSLRDSWDEFDKRFLSGFQNAEEITVEDRLSVYSSSVYAWIQAVISRLDLALKGIEKTFAESIYIVEFLRSTFCTLFSGTPLLCASPTLLEGIREAQGYSGIDVEHAKFFSFVNGSKDIKRFLSEYSERSVLLIPSDQRFELIRQRFSNEGRTDEVELLKSLLLPTRERLGREKLEVLDLSDHYDANARPFDFKRIAVESIRSLGAEKTFGSESTEIYFVNPIE